MSVVIVGVRVGGRVAKQAKRPGQVVATRLIGFFAAFAARWTLHAGVVVAARGREVRAAEHAIGLRGRAPVPLPEIELLEAVARE